jgi:hypothetical protein
MRLITFLLLFFVLGCEKPPFRIEALVPDYFDALDFSGIESLEAQPVINQGAIVKVGDYLFINDKKRGIHVVDNSQPGSPYYLLFWKIPGNQTFTINGNYLYADNGPHMLIINISNFENIQYESYIENVFFENMIDQFPEEAPGGQYFNCPEPDKGLVKSWTQEIVENPICQKI